MSEATRLVDELRRYVTDERVLAAIGAVPREAFVPDDLRPHAYDNTALGIGCGQTISQPLVVARMSELLELDPGDRVLDVGTGSGYHAAVLAALSAHVWSVERHADLSQGAAEALEAAGVENVTLAVGDGARGLPDEAPFDAINVAAAGVGLALTRRGRAGRSAPPRGDATSPGRAPVAPRPGAGAVR